MFGFRGAMGIVIALITTTGVPLAAQSHGADGEVFLATELSLPPRLQQSTVRYYPSDETHRRGRVTLMFVVDTAGRPESTTVKFVGVPDSLLSEAARLTILARRYSPGHYHGLAVRTLIRTEIVIDVPAGDCGARLISKSLALCVDSAATR